MKKSHSQSLLNKLLREPLVHFLFIGAFLFLLYGIQNEDIVENNRIVISEANIDRLITLWEKKRQRLPTQEELNGLIEQQVREEVMVREALAMGLDKNDSVVRRRLAQKVEFISSDIAATVDPTDRDLAEYLNTHTKKFETPATISFEHVYFNSDKRGAEAKTDAARLLSKLNKSNSNIDIRAAGDAFMMGMQHEDITEYGTSRLFGENFAAKLFTLDTGDWQSPIDSEYGYHLVRINKKTLSKPATLSAVRDRVRIEWLAEQRRTFNQTFYEILRQRYDILIESSPDKEKLTSARP